MALEDSELLDIIRRLRTYMITLDNVHHVLNLVQGIDDVEVSKQAKTLLTEVPDMNKKVSLLLRGIESSKPYRDMAKKYNIKEDEE